MVSFVRATREEFQTLQPPDDAAYLSNTAVDAAFRRCDGVPRHSVLARGRRLQKLQEVQHPDGVMHLYNTAVQPDMKRYRWGIVLSLCRAASQAHDWYKGLT